MHKLLFKPEVYGDIKIAYDWYESQRAGLGEDFLLTLEASYADIARAPEQYQDIYKSVRRKLVRSFPYGIFFVVRGNSVVVLAVLHIKRDQKSWKKRL